MNIAEIASFVVPLIVAITFHEAAHGFVADKCGDPTAKRLGRVTFNPLSHIDPFGTIILPCILYFGHANMLFGYAKPVPVNFVNLRHFRRDSLLVALAGPGMNLVLGFVSALALHLEAFVTPEQAPWLFMNLYNSVRINVVLAVFNMIPLLPLDGGRVLSALLPPPAARIYAKMERFGMIALLLLLLSPSIFPSAGNFIFQCLEVPEEFMSDTIFHAAGIGIENR